MHFESCAIECSPDTAQIVADVLAEVDGETVIAECKLGLDELAAEVHDCCCGP